LTFSATCKEGEPGAEQHQCDADGDVVHLGELADVTVQRAEGRARRAGGEHAEPGRAALIVVGVAGHRAEDEGALETEIDAAGFLGEALAEADEEERRRHADGAGEHGEKDDGDARFAVHRGPAFPRKKGMRP
jgi:hypothetical protein